jgi:hypothetical protein
LGRKNTAAVGALMLAGEKMKPISSPGEMDPMTMLAAVSGFDEFFDQTLKMERFEVATKFFSIS